MHGSSAIDTIYRRHGHVVFRRAARILGSEADAREIVQELFASLVARPEQFHGKSEITTFLYSATTHLCLNQLRDRRTRARLLDEQVAPNVARVVQARAEESVALSNLLAKLPEDIATAAVHYYLDEMTHEEIAGVMNCSRRHVGNLLERLRESVEDLEAQACAPS